MKKSVLIIMGLLMMSGLVRAQIIEGFNTKGSLGNYVDNKWGTLADSIYQTVDPTNSNNGVAAIALDLKGTGTYTNDALGLAGSAKGKISSGGAQLLTIWVYIPAADSTMPDSVDFQTYYQPAAGWAWTSHDNFAVDITKGKWFPLSMPIRELAISDPSGHAISGSNDIGDFGIQFQVSGSSADSTWKGVVYVDSSSLVGAQPLEIGKFKTSLGNFKIGWDNGAVDSLSWVAGPIGDSLGVARVWQINDSSISGDAGIFLDVSDGGNYDFSLSTQLAVWVWADTGYTDSTGVQDSTRLLVYAQDRSHWGDPRPLYPPVYLGMNIPKRVWYPIYFDLGQANAADGATTFNSAANKLGWYGLFMGGKPGVVYVSDVQALSYYVANLAPPVWVAADFENPGTSKNPKETGLQGFHVPSSAYGTVSVTYVTYTSNFTNVMQAAVDFSKGSFEVVRDSLPMTDAADSIATDISFQVYLPNKMPAHGIVTFFLSGGTGDSVAVVDTIGVQVKTVQWNTVTIKGLDALANAGKFDPTKPARVGIKVSYPAPYDTTKWSGNLLFDNLIVNGIWFGSEIPDGVKNSNLPKVYQLYSNYPNPFNPSTMIKYDLPKDSKVVLQVYDVLGREVATLFNGKQPAGSYNLRFDGSDYASGIYFVRLTAGSYIKTQKMMLIK